jgi:cell wall-associated NlpC family hydrolase
VPFARARIFARPSLFLAILMALLFATALPVSAAATETDRVVTIAKNQIGDPWVWGRTGPNSFDCVGFVWFSFDRADLAFRIGGYRGVRSYWDHFKSKGRASRYNGQRGDLVIWGPRSNPAKHIGIYLGKGRAISALTSGVKIHGIHQLTDPFQTFLHVRLERG